MLAGKPDVEVDVGGGRGIHFSSCRQPSYRETGNSFTHCLMHCLTPQAVDGMIHKACLEYEKSATAGKEDVGKESEIMDMRQD